MAFVNPPVHEVSLSVSFASRAAASDYDVRQIHDLFREELPVCQRAPAFQGSELLPALGVLPLNSEEPVPSRWWFKSEDDALLLQVQENFLALNWRRRTQIDSPNYYPGFDILFETFKRHVETLRQWLMRNDSAMPNPIATELFYDDLIRFPSSETERIRLSDVLAFWPAQERQLAGWNLAWAEPLADPPTVEAGVLKFAATVAGVSGEVTGGTLRPIVRLNWTALAATRTWEESDSFLQRAHGHISERFNEVVTASARATWEMETA